MRARHHSPTRHPTAVVSLPAPALKVGRSAAPPRRRTRHLGGDPLWLPKRQASTRDRRIRLPLVGPSGKGNWRRCDASSPLRNIGGPPTRLGPWLAVSGVGYRGGGPRLQASGVGGHEDLPARGEKICPADRHGICPTRRPLPRSRTRWGPSSTGVALGQQQMLNILLRRSATPSDDLLVPAGAGLRSRRGDAREGAMDGFGDRRPADQRSAATPPAESVDDSSPAEPWADADPRDTGVLQILST